MRLELRNASLGYRSCIAERDVEAKALRNSQEMKLVGALEHLLWCEFAVCKKLLVV
jgi:hypothetical protein